MSEGASISRSGGRGRDERPRPEPSARNEEAGAAENPLLSPLRELQLVKDHRGGDPEALSALLRSYQRRMYGVCYRMLRNDDEARDVTQDAMIKVIEGLDGFDARSRLSTWIVRVTMNTCISHLRKRKLRQHQRLDSPESGSPGRGGQGVAPGDWLAEEREPSPASRVERDESREIVLRALESVDPAMRGVLVLRDMHDLDYQQIADVLEVPVGTVKSRLFRARAALRNAIEGIEEPKE